MTDLQLTTSNSTGTPDKLLAQLFERLLPAIVVCLAGFAFVFYATQTSIYPRAEHLQISALEDIDGSFPASITTEVVKKLQSQPTVTHIKTEISRNPFWFLITATGSGDKINIPSRHTVSLTCWDAKQGTYIGSADRSSTSGSMSPGLAGFSVPTSAGSSIVCKGLFRGPAKISANQWRGDALSVAQKEYEQTRYTIESGLGLLAVFLLLTAAFNKNTLYFIFSGFLVLNMRLAAISAGTDFWFLDTTISPNFLYETRKWTLGAYFAITVSLFSILFREEIRLVRLTRYLHIQYGMAIFLLGLLPFVSFEVVIRSIWLLTTAGSVVVAYCLARIIRQTKSRIAIWYALSIGITILASLAEVIAAATNIPIQGLSINNVTAAFTSAMLASIAMAERMHGEVTQRRNAQNALKNAYDGSPIGLFTVQRGGLISKANKTFLALTERESIDHGNQLADFFSPDVIKGFQALQNPDSTEANTFEAQTRVKFTLSERWLSVTASIAEDGCVEASLIDITDQILARQELEHLASHDPLTECLNRRGLTQKLESSDFEFSALAYFDLDRFKLINDLYGHNAGDSVLKQVCSRIRSTIGDANILARVGGDEFVVVFPSASLIHAKDICEKVVQVIASSPYPIDTQSFAMNISGGLIGVQSSKNAMFSIAEIFSHADTLCRMAKKRTSERVVVKGINDQFFLNHKEELELINCLTHGKTPDGLFLVMQPEISLSKPFDSLDFEILLRLRKPDGSVISAGIIIEAAESQGKTAIVDRWVLHTAIDWIEKNFDRLTKTRFIGINLSGGSLNDENFMEEMFRLFERHPKAISKICLEITETVALTDMQNMQRFIDRIRSMGVKVSLDDFGAGYSSFGYLRGLSVDALKLDGSLVRDAAKSQAGMAIITAIAGLVGNLGMQSIGEFAEDESSLRALSNAGVDYAQGYAISAPVLPERILAASSAADFIEDQSILEFIVQLQTQTHAWINPQLDNQGFGEQLH